MVIDPRKVFYQRDFLEAMVHGVGGNSDTWLFAGLLEDVNTFFRFYWP